MFYRYNAQACTDAEAPGFPLETEILDHFPHAIGKKLGLFKRAVLHQNREFITTKSRQRVSGANLSG